jgi:hypothetical protein
VVHEDAPHHLRRDAEELSTVLPHHRPLIDKTKIRLVDEGGRLQRVVRPFLAKVSRSAAAKLLINDRHQSVARVAIAGAPPPQQCRDIPVGARRQG